MEATDVMGDNFKHHCLAIPFEGEGETVDLYRVVIFLLGEVLEVEVSCGGEIERSRFPLLFLRGVFVIT